MTEKTVTQHLSAREYYAQMGVNYDKATRRFLEQHSEQTVKLSAAEVQALVPASKSEVVP